MRNFSLITATCALPSCTGARRSNSNRDNAATANSLGGAYLRMGNAAECGRPIHPRRCVRERKCRLPFQSRKRGIHAPARFERGLERGYSGSARRALAEFRAASRLSPNDVEYARAYAETFYGVPNPDWADGRVGLETRPRPSPRTKEILLTIATRPDQLETRATRTRRAAVWPNSPTSRCDDELEAPESTGQKADRLVAPRAQFDLDFDRVEINRDRITPPRLRFLIGRLWPASSNCGNAPLIVFVWVASYQFR